MSPPAEEVEDHRRIRVLWLSKGLDVGGTELLLTYLAEARGAGVDYEVGYLIPRKRGLVDRLERLGVATHCLDGAREFDLRWAARLRDLMIRGGFDIVHSHSPYVAGVARLTARTIPRSRRPRLMSTEHVPWWAYVAASRVLNALTFHLDDLHLTVSKSIANSIPRPFRRRVRPFIHGIDQAHIRNGLGEVRRIREELQVHSSRTLIGTVANLRAQKDYPNLLRAARLMLDDGQPVSFVAVGRGPEEARIRELHAELGLGEDFRLLGYRDDATEVLAACDIFVLASSYEGFPLALMEAMALGLPAVATNVGGVGEAITDGVEGFLVPPSDSRALADALAELVTNEGRRRQMGFEARRRSAQFDIRAAAPRIESIYREVIAG